MRERKPGDEEVEELGFEKDQDGTRTYHGLWLSISHWSAVYLGCEPCLTHAWLGMCRKTHLWPQQPWNDFWISEQAEPRLLCTALRAVTAVTRLPQLSSSISHLTQQCMFSCNGNEILFFLIVQTINYYWGFLFYTVSQTAFILWSLWNMKHHLTCISLK